MTNQCLCQRSDARFNSQFHLLRLQWCSGLKQTKTRAESSLFASLQKNLHVSCQPLQLTTCLFNMSTGGVCVSHGPSDKQLRCGFQKKILSRFQLVIMFVLYSPHLLLVGGGAVKRPIYIFCMFTYPQDQPPIKVNHSENEGLVCENVSSSFWDPCGLKTHHNS